MDLLSPRSCYFAHVHKLNDARFPMNDNTKAEPSRAVITNYCKAINLLHKRAGIRFHKYRHAAMKMLFSTTRYRLRQMSHHQSTHDKRVDY